LRYAVSFEVTALQDEGSHLLADDAQVVGRFELSDPIVEELDAVRPAQAIQFVEPDRSLA
jgi:hypothetical protein